MRIARIIGLLTLLAAYIGFSNALESVSSNPIKPSPLDNTENLIKRDLKLSDESSQAKSFDPPPEYYRGPGSNYERERDRTKDGGVIGLNRPFTTTSSSSPTNGYDSKFRIKGGGNSGLNRFGSDHFNSNRDRIGSGGYYGPPSDSGDYYSLHNQQSTLPYGNSQPIDFSKHTISSPGLYQPSGHTAGSSTTSNVGHSNTGHYPGEQAATGLDWDHNKGGYNDYGRPYIPSGYGPVDGSSGSGNGWDSYYPGKAALTKSFLLPLAGAALLGITAALIANPVLLHLGAVAGKRKRDLNEQENFSKINDDDFAQNLAYKKQK